MRIATIVGARPQFIKAAAVSAPLRTRHQEILIHTGQHHDAEMSDVFFAELGIPAADHHLGIHGGSPGEMVGRMLDALTQVLSAEAPDVVLVYGDTNSTLAGGLAGAGLGIPVVHVEAGLRSFDARMPEERNRIAVDRLAALRLCTHEAAAAQLAREGLSVGTRVVGDVMRDVLERGRELLRQRDPEPLPFGVRPGEYVVATLHRAGNTEDATRLGQILSALAALPLPVVFPLHPRTRQAVERAGLSLRGAIRATPPLGYLQMLQLMSTAAAIVTDSGGLQKEAMWLAVPCVTVRPSTEWVETVETGWNRLVAADAAAVERAVREAKRPAQDREPYGPVGAAQRVVTAIDEELS